MPGLDAPFTRPLRRLAAAHAVFAAEGRVPSRDPAEMLGWYEAQVRHEWEDARREAEGSPAARPTRRRFLTGGLGVAASALLPGLSALPATAGPPLRDVEPVVIVGAGLAGLTCAYRLTRHGIPVRVYEAQERLGGRCWTIRDQFAHGATGEHGGQWIDSRHHHIRSLATELGLDLIDTFAQEPPSAGPEFYWLDGAARSPSDVFAGYDDFVRAIRAEYRRTGRYFYDQAGPQARAFDQRTSKEWIDANVANPLLAQALALFETGFFGIEAAEQSAINLFESQVIPYPGADERFRVLGGNDRLISAMAAALPPGSIAAGRELVAAGRAGDGRVRLTLTGESADVVASRVVLALPFTTLREVDYAGLGLPERRTRAVETLAMGTNAKFYLQFDRPYAESGFGSFFVTDDPSSWYAFDTEKDQDVPDHDAPLLLVYSGGQTGRSYPTSTSEGPAPQTSVTETLAALDRGSTGNPPLSAGYNGKNYLVTWVNNPWVHGSYAGFGPGQYTDFWGYLEAPEPGLFFAGEHTSTHSQGYLNGGVESGERAANQVLRGFGSRA